MDTNNTNVTHRPGVFKHPNKVHKTGRHRSKNSISKEVKGKSDVKTITKNKKQSRQLKKQEKKNRLNQLRKQKREEILEQKRSRGTHNTPPFLVTVFPTRKSHINRPDKLVELLEGCDDVKVVATERSCHISCQRFKQRYEFIFPNSLIDYMDAVKVSDCLMLLISIGRLNFKDDDEEDDEYGKMMDKEAEKILSCLFSQGLSSVALCCLGLKELPVKKQSEMKKEVLKIFETRFPDEKLLSLDSMQDAILLLKHIGSQRLNKVTYRDLRGHIFASHVEFTCNDDDDACGADDVSKGTLEISGYLRGSRLSANQLLHIPGYGNFQISVIKGPPDPYLIRVTNHKIADMTEEIQILNKPHPVKQESLECEVEVDQMENEQTWPTEEELKEAEKNIQMKKIKKKLVPKGFSDYQASWLDTNDDDDDEDDDDDMVDDDGIDDDDDDDDKKTYEDGDEEEEGEEETEEMETMSIKDDDDVYDEKFDQDEEKELLKKYKEARLQEMFPDEIDTPQHQPARVRFQRYRGLSSFRTSPWDPRENLPLDYGKIVRFDNFKVVRKRVLKKIQEEDDDEDEEEEKVKPGAYVTICISDVPSKIAEQVNSAHPIVAFALLPFEQKLSVLHFLIRRCHGDREPIKSKEPMIMHVGCHRFQCRPIYSQHTNASKHKFEKFFPPESTLVATVYAPIIFPPATVLMFKDDGVDGENRLIGTGTLLSVNPDRMIIKRIVLSGHPFKINRKSAVVRYMFFNREDILWFKPVELRTKYGRNGHIKEPLGTHGHMKCIFNKQLQSQDTVLMNLYKRVYPKWNDFKQLYK